MNTRRAFLQQTVSLAAAAALPSEAVETKNPSLVDCNITLGHWPFRYQVGQGFAHLRQCGLTQGWAGSFEGIFHRDPRLANEVLHEHCTEDSARLLLPVYTINPALPSWEKDFDHCHEVNGLRAIRLHPNYHGYTLDDPRFLELLTAAAEKRFLVQIAAQMEDERTQHPLMRVPPVDFKPLRAALEKVPQSRVMVLNANRAMSMTTLQGCQVTLDIAMLEGVGGIETLLKDWPLEQLVFGSHSPLFYFESAQLKLQESDLNDQQLNAITHENAQHFLS